MVANEFLSLSYKQLVEEDYLEHKNEKFNRAVNGITQNYESIVLHKNGHAVPVNVTNIPIIVDDEIVGVYGIAKDLTKQKQSEDMLLRSEKLSVVGQLAASIAHEIRNPLTSLKGFLQLLQSSINSVPDYFHIMRDEIERIESITNELLLNAKPQARDFQKEKFTEIVENVVVLLNPQALINNVVINVKYEEIPPISCIANQLKQVLINVIKNSIESMPNGGELKIHLRKISEDEICLQVADQGCGIPKEYLSKIGLPFYTKGTGLGMLTTFSIVEEAHGGRIKIFSEVGKGTKIDIYLFTEPKVSKAVSQ
ncbi:ATP-binding protein [Bacillus sp. PS06]|uniref:ATP-binding protein n=1 Tax=Bacillus sp. PS06 TaxID=2764176 RepID=UPI00177EC94F|nr:ATP-binding protein [Bacillus sp. PS06]MBD8071076.1 PAS domain S-box protein [Bacillus sp. PS06]